jgi:NADPH-dependent 2,4-dienoyl-CoA reductase/sulfur reductase-like enzyme
MEHWDNAQAQGKRAGENMAGANQPFDYMPLFFSDLFELGYEAVGLVRTSLETVCDWQEENKTGVIYYLQNKKVRGVLLCNVWEKVDAARALIKAGQPADASSLRGAIK